jgi:PEGA domain
MAPVIPSRPPAAATVAPAIEPASSVPAILTPPAPVATDAPTTTDVDVEPPAPSTKPRRVQPAHAAAVLSTSHDDLPDLKPQRSRWPLVLGAAAALALGVVGLRQLDHAPTPTPAELARPVNAAKPVAKAANAVPKSDDDDDDGPDPNAGTDAQPQPLPPDADPVNANGKAKGDSPKPASDRAAASPAAPAAATPPADTTTSAVPAGSGATIHINVTSDPPGARLFWKGKEQGTTPFVLEFPAGERHSYELGLPGYTVRKVVIDGTKTDITIGLRPDPAGTSGASPRK